MTRLEAVLSAFEEVGVYLNPYNVVCRICPTDVLSELLESDILFSCDHDCSKCWNEEYRIERDGKIIKNVVRGGHMINFLK